MQRVFVLSNDEQPLNSCHPACARQLLKQGRAAVFRRYPFTIILKDRTAAESVAHPHRVKVDPGSRTTGIAIVQEQTGRVVWAAELSHRGEWIKRRMLARRQLRRGRRGRKCRYRQPRFDNRRRPAGWLPPSLQSRVANVETWVARLRRYAPVVCISFELAKFDTQKMQNPEISGVEYRQGTLQGYTVREYLLEKWGRECAYCSAENVPLQVEHIVPKSRGGTNKYGFPIRHAPRAKRFQGWQTGDQVRAVIPIGKYAGVHTGRVIIRFRPSFQLNGIDVHPKYLTLLQKADGYEYT